MSDRVYTIPWKQKLYNGVNFRSTLEARWAVFFDAIGVKWAYEKKQFFLAEYFGTDLYIYWPDFALLSCPFHYVEIKPTNPTSDEYARCLALSKHDCNVAIFAGPVHPEKVDVFLFYQGQRVFVGANFWDCLRFGISKSQCDRIASIKAVLGKRNYMKGFKAAWEAFR